MKGAFDPGNLKPYKNIKEHITKQAQKGGLEEVTKKLIQEQMQPPGKQARPRKNRQ